CSWGRPWDSRFLLFIAFRAIQTFRAPIQTSWFVIIWMSGQENACQYSTHGFGLCICAIQLLKSRRHTGRVLGLQPRDQCIRCRFEDVESETVSVPPPFS